MTPSTRLIERDGLWVQRIDAVLYCIMSERAYCRKVQSMMSIYKSPRTDAGSLAGRVWFATVWPGLVRSEDLTGPNHVDCHDDDGKLEHWSSGR